MFCHLMSNISVHIARLQYFLRILMRIVRGEYLRMRRLKKQGRVPQQVWHYKDPSLLKGPERRA